MMATKFVIEGTQETKRRIREFGRQVGGTKSRRVVAAALSKATTPAVRAMRLAVPQGKKTEGRKSYKGFTIFGGHLRRSIRKRRGTDKNTGRQFSEIGVLQSAFYGVHFLPFGIAGKKRIRPQDWFFEVFDRKSNEAIKIYNKEVIRLIDKTVKKLSANDR